MYQLNVVNPRGGMSQVTCRWRWYALLLGAVVELLTKNVTYIRRI